MNRVAIAAAGVMKTSGLGMVEGRMTWRQAVGIPLNVALFVVLMVLGWGDLRGFFAHPVRAGLVVTLALMTPVMTFCTSGRSRGVRSAPDWAPYLTYLHNAGLGLGAVGVLHKVRKAMVVIQQCLAAINAAWEAVKAERRLS